jgi:GNAT superfamily N-acetyltransferase
MRAYLASSHAFILTARHNFQIAGYVAVVINPGFAIETRRLFRLARQLFIAIRGGYGWNIRYWLRIARKIYVRLWKDPSLRTRQRIASSKEPTAWVNGIVVDEQWRGRGVAGQLLQAAHAKLMEMNVGIVGADTPADNAASLRAFAKAGYRPSSWVRLQAGAATQIVIKCLQK